MGIILKYYFGASILFLLTFSCTISYVPQDSKVSEIAATHVNFSERSLLGERLNVNATVTIWHNLYELEKEGYLDNFRVAAGIKKGNYRGTKLGYADSEVNVV